MAITVGYDSGVHYVPAPGSSADRRACWNPEEDTIIAHAWGVDLAMLEPDYAEEVDG